MRKRTNTKLLSLSLMLRMPSVAMSDYYKMDDDWMYRRNRVLLYVTSKVSSELDSITDAIIVNTRRRVAAGY